MTINVEGLQFVESKLSFVADGVSSPVNYFGVVPPAGEPELFPRKNIQVNIFDARGSETECDLQRNGFVLISDPVTGIDDFYNDEKIKTIYYPSLENLIKRITGAHTAVVFDHTYRSGGNLDQGPTNINPVVPEAHNDYTDTSGPERVREMTEKCAPEMNVDQFMQGRYGIYNVWRSINGTVEEKPLTLCDMSSMQHEDFVPCILKWPQRTGYVNVVRYSEQQRWFYFSRMNQDEALVFKCYDSQQYGNMRYTSHSAFNDPTSAEGCRTRESIESRIIVYF